MHHRLELNPWNKILMSPGGHFLIPSLAFWYGEKMVVAREFHTASEKY
jgi:hypothetical protein